MTALSLSWKPEENRHLTMTDVIRLLGADHVEWLKAQSSPSSTAKSRADGAWQANDRQSFAAYTSFAELWQVLVVAKCTCPLPGFLANGAHVKNCALAKSPQS
jgi:hypothetical protein